MANFSFDVVSTYDKAEMINAFQATLRDISNRYDFKNTPASIDWIDDKKGVEVTGNSAWQLESIIEIFRRNLANRGLSSKVLNLDVPSVDANLKTTKKIPFKEGLDKDKSKLITKLLKEKVPKAKASIQGDAVRVNSSSKDNLQEAIETIKNESIDFPLIFTNYR